MKSIKIIFVAVLVFMAMVVNLSASYQGPDGLYYQYKITNWYHKLIGASYVPVPGGTLYFSDVNTYSGVVVQGPLGLEDFSIKWRLHFLDHGPDFFQHADDLLTFSPEVNWHRSRWYERRGDQQIPHESFENPSYPGSMPSDIPIITPEMGTTYAAAGTISIVVPPPTAPIIPTSGSYSFDQFWGVVTWTNVSYSLSPPGDDEAGHFDIDSEPGESAGAALEAVAVPVVQFTANGRDISNGGFFPGGGAWSYQFRASGNSAVDGLMSVWKCTGAVTNNNTAISPATYTMMNVDGGADFAATECGLYNFEVKTMFKTVAFTIRVGHPEISYIDFGIWNHATPVGFVDPTVSLSVGTHLFSLVEWDPVYGDYGMVLNYQFSVAPYGDSNQEGISYRILDYNGLPSLDGRILEITIITPGYYSVSVSATCPALPGVEGNNGFDVNAF